MAGRRWLPTAMLAVLLVTWAALTPSPSGATGTAGGEGPAVAAGYAGSGSANADWFVLRFTVPSGTTLQAFHIELVSTRPFGNYDGLPLPSRLGHFHHFVAPSGLAVFSHGFLWDAEIGSYTARAGGLAVDGKELNPITVANTTGGSVDIRSPFPLSAGTYYWIIVAEPAGLLEVSYEMTFSQAVSVAHGFGSGGFLADHRDMDATAQAWVKGVATAGHDWEMTKGASKRMVAWTLFPQAGGSVTSWGLDRPGVSHESTRIVAGPATVPAGNVPEFLIGGPGDYRWWVEATAQAGGPNHLSVMAADVDLSVA